MSATSKDASQVSERDGRYEVVRPCFDRRLAMEAFAALPQGHTMVALLELDVTAAQRAIAAHQLRGTHVSLFAFLVHAIAVAIAEHPDMNLVCHGKRVVRFEDVDVSVPVEVSTEGGVFPRQIVIRRAQRRSPQDIYGDIEAAKVRQHSLGETGPEDRFYRHGMRAMRVVPRRVRQAVLRLMMGNAFTIKRTAGTTLVTSVGKFASIPGFGFTFTTGPRAASFAIGGVVDRPWLHEGAIVVRSILPLAIMVNHDLVDGGPAARFAKRLQQLVESAEGL